MALNTEKQSILFPEIEKVAAGFDFGQITGERKTALQPLIGFIQSKRTNRQEVRLNLICTHNSRRSHLAQVWAQTAAAFYGIENVFCYSGGTEATALYPMVAQTLGQTGFFVGMLSHGKNPVYAIKFAENQHPVIGFSKRYDDEFNPKAAFAAIMTCSQADAECPFVSGAEIRIPMPFDDPKVFDETPQQQEKYRQRSMQIATEMFYVFSKITK